MDKTQNNLEGIEYRLLEHLEQLQKGKIGIARVDAYIKLNYTPNSQIKQSNEKYLDDFVNWNDKEFNVIPFKQYLKDKVQRFEQYKSKEREE